MFRLSLAAQLVALSLAAAALAPAAGRLDDYALAHDHFYNLEYDEAIQANRRLIKQHPGDPLVYTDLAASILYKELLRLGKLETKAFKDDNDFLSWEKPLPDPKAAEDFEKALRRGREVAEAALEKDPRDPRALYSLSTNYGLEANYKFMVKKAYIGALRTGNKADSLGQRLIKTKPDFVDGYLVVGTHEYVVGSLPWAVRYMVAIGGIRGSKEKGERYVTRVAQEGDLARDGARALLILMLRRESRPLEAVKVIEGLIRDYPRNYLMHLELAGLYEDAGQEDKALQVFRRIQAKVQANQDRFGRMPARAREALTRKIKELERELQTRHQSFARPASLAARHR